MISGGCLSTMGFCGAAASARARLSDTWCWLWSGCGGPSRRGAAFWAARGGLSRRGAVCPRNRRSIFVCLKVLPSEPIPRPSTPCYGWEEGSGQSSPRDEHSSAVGTHLVRPRRSGRSAPRARCQATARVVPKACAAGQPLFDRCPRAALTGCPRRALATRTGPTSDPRARKWVSWNVSAATASRRRPTTASPRRCRPLT